MMKEILLCMFVLCFCFACFVCFSLSLTHSTHFISSSFSTVCTPHIGSKLFIKVMRWQWFCCLFHYTKKRTTMKLINIIAFSIAIYSTSLLLFGIFYLPFILILSNSMRMENLNEIQWIVRLENEKFTVLIMTHKSYGGSEWERKTWGGKVSKC